MIDDLLYLEQLPQPKVSVKRTYGILLFSGYRRLIKTHNMYSHTYCIIIYAHRYFEFKSLAYFVSAKIIIVSEIKIVFKLDVTILNIQDYFESYEIVIGLSVRVNVYY